MNRHMKRKMRALGLLTVMMTVSAQMAFAITTDDVIASYQAEGYERIEIKQGPTQIKVEAIRGTEKVETIYDTETGEVLKSEMETVEEGENVTPGVSVRLRDEDFLDADDLDEDDDEDDDDEDDDDGDDDDDDDDGDDDDDDDDDNSGHGGGDNDGDDDHGGSGGGSGGGSDDD
jgi:phosphopantothenoylcysteine synthetase/decarboxylase